MQQPAGAMFALLVSESNKPLQQIVVTSALRAEQPLGQCRDEGGDALLQQHLGSQGGLSHI